MLRRTVLAGVAALMMLAGSVVSAGAASADVVADPCTRTDYSVVNGTTVSFTFSGACTLTSAIDQAIEFTGATIDTSGITGGLGTLLITITGDNQWVVVTIGLGTNQWVTGCGLAYENLGFYTDHVNLCPPPAEPGVATPPADSVQAVGLPRSGSCDAVVDAGMDYGTGLTGGWKQSWEGWLNEGTGGAVCTRTLHYSLDLARWVIAD